MTGPGDLVAGRYRLHWRIGIGGMGTVWLARDELLGRQVAVKQVVPPPGADVATVDQQRQRALREGRIAARLSHPHAISVYDVAVEAGAPWLVMEYLPSRSLAEVLNEDGILRVDQVAQVGAQVADALAATHAAGIVHRDVKPANVLIGQGPRVEGLVKITDFGISHARGDVTLTQTGQITGTPAFLAPEVAQGAEMSPASDVFSLGATLYTCLEGQPPFGMDDNALRLLHRVAGGGPTPPKRAGSMTGPLTRMLADDPGQRPTMTEVRDELARLAAGRDGDPTTVLLARTSLRSSTNRDRTAELGQGGAAAAGVAAAATAGRRSPDTAVEDLPVRQPAPDQPVPEAPPRTAPEPPPAAPRTLTTPAHDPATARPPTSVVTARPRKRRPLLVAALLVLVLAIAGVLWLTTRGGDGGGTPSADPTTPSATEEQPAPSSSAEPSEPEPAEPAEQAQPTEAEPTEEDPAPPADPAAAAQQTLDQYYAHLPDDPAAAYALTGPQLRSRIGPQNYAGFWSEWAEVSLVSLRDVVDQGDGVVTATTEVEFRRADGSGMVEEHAVTFARAADGSLLVDLDVFEATVG
ncbi:serine/threonine-protein kinase [Geodermatophilus sabuli]|uniref:serine/threonine-protein kinase n=1 Tax=Geodermatophilus sabuli TaxID=1564158 RepID=UPI001954F27A|nr:serine/threonine-protein kinase [Geodermatophilus sabuli]